MLPYIILPVKNLLTKHFCPSSLIKSIKYCNIIQIYFDKYKKDSMQQYYSLGDTQHN